MINMIFKGGLGNQMFQYALYRKFEIMGKSVIGNISVNAERGGADFCLLDVFPHLRIALDYEKNAQKIIEKTGNDPFLSKLKHILYYPSRRIFVDKDDGEYDRRILSLKNGVLDGYWQTSKYWNDINYEIIDCFHFSDQFDKDLAFYYSIISNQNVVSVHIRGGDYLCEANKTLFADICTHDYYKNAIAFLEERLRNVIYLIFTNDMGYAHLLFNKINNKNALFFREISGNNFPDWVEMMLMSKCKYHILANSSFSWWGAYLNQANNLIVISPNKWINGKDTKDIWEKEWIKMV